MEQKVFNNSPPFTVSTPDCSRKSQQKNRNGFDTFLSRRVNGLSLDNDARLADALRTGELSKEKIETKMAELSNAVKWVNEQGYFHNDISNLGNIMYDTKAKIFVLIDSEQLGKQPKYKFNTEPELVDQLKNHLFTVCSKL